MIGAASPMPELPVTPFPDAPDAAPHPLVTALAPDLNGDDNHQRRRPVEPPHAGSALGRRVREAVTGTLGPLVSSLGIGTLHASTVDTERHRQFAVDNLEQLAWLHDRLADDYSRSVLVDLLRCRIVGRTDLARPGARPSYQSMQARVDQDLLLAQRTKHPWRPDFNRYRIPGMHGPIELHADRGRVLDTFLLEQYAYVRGSTTVRAQPGGVVIDAGSCWGDAALYFADLVGPNGRVYAVELVASKCALIEENLALNPRLRERISVIERAVSDRSGDTVGYEPDGPSATPTPVRMDPWGSFVADVPTVAIDDLIADMGLDRVDSIKLDVDGLELAALVGARATILRHRPTLVVALSHDEGDLVTIPRHLDALTSGYDFFLECVAAHGEKAFLFARPRAARR
ncbi:MAG: FkbM family methyltransferase [Chloroflexi bacterium]|nr:FkbM family methyltransferase [Chloroflexota bacterium]